MQNPFLNKEGKISKTKVGTFLVGLSVIAGTVGGFLQGAIPPVPAIQALTTEVGAILALFGLRDSELLSGKKSS